MSRIAIIIQRYGKEVSGGGEFYARALAHQLKKTNDVTVITTTSLELDFSKYYSSGIFWEDGVKVIRFDNDRPRNFQRMGELSNDEIATINEGHPTRMGVDLQWADEWGPNCPRLVQYVQKNADEYDAFIIFTYIYYTSIRTIPIVKDKTIFIPTAHDEIWARPTIFKHLYSMPRYIGFLTEGEERFVRSYYHNDSTKGEIIGCGVELPQNIDNRRFREKYQINEPYIAYVGRVDASKGCDKLIEYFIKYKKTYGSQLKLVLMGGGNINAPNRDDIVFTGFVSEEDKFDGLSGALVTVAPSKYESLCIAVLESFSCGIPILANGECEILKEHCQNGKTGFSYTSDKEFLDLLHKIIDDEKKLAEMGMAAKEYIAQNYTWEIVTKKINKMVEDIKNNSMKQIEKENNIEKEFLVRNVFMDNQFDNEIIYANKETKIQPFFDSDSVCICLTSSDYFSPMCAVAVQSIITNASENKWYDILILTNGMSFKNKKMIGGLATKNCSIRFVEFEDNLFSEEIATHDSYSIYTYYRLMIPSICELYEKVLYLDSDMVINHDVAEVYDIDVTDYYCAAVLDLTILTWQVMKERHPLYSYLKELDLTEPGTYMQGGVAVYNTKKISQDYPVEVLIKKANERQYQNCDQELLNICFKNRIKFLDVKWNVVVMHPAYIDLYEYWMPYDYYNMYIEARKNPYIIHYSFQQIPCYQTGVDMFEYFWRYAKQTPYYEELLVMLMTRQSQNSGVGIANTLSGTVTSKKKQLADKLLPIGTKRREYVKKIYHKIRGYN